MCLCGVLGWFALDASLAEVRYETRVESVSPSKACLSGGVMGLVGDLLGGGERAKRCNVLIAVRVTVHNPSPLAAAFAVESVRARISGRDMPPEAIDLPEYALTVPAGGSASHVVRFRADVGDLIAAASGLLLTSEVTVEVDAQVHVSALGGLIGSRRSVHIEKALTVRDITSGFDGSAATK